MAQEAPDISQMSFEDALRALRPGDLGVRVGAGETAAKIRVDDISELAALLVRLAHERVAARE